jgi:2-oxoisovalerate dehydrogenase E1 component alpha subunit
MIEALVSRLHGHSSSSGAARVAGETDCVELFERKLLEAGALDADDVERVRAAARAEVEAAVQQAVREPKPTVADVYKHTYAPSPVDMVYPEDYTGLPQ